MKTFTQLKKDLEVGKMVRTNYNFFGKNLGLVRKITKKQTNAIRLDNSYLDFPPTSNQVEYDGNIFRFYSVGERDFNEKELKALEEWKKITETDEYRRQAKCDMYTDGSSTYYKEKAFWYNKGMEYMFHEKKGGLERTYEDKIRDNSLKGELRFEYEIVEG